MKEKKPINLSWLVEKWTLVDEDSYLKNMWLNTESLDFVRINKEIESVEDIEANYIDIDSDVENYILMPTEDELCEQDLRSAFLSKLSRQTRDNFVDSYEGISPREEFMDKVYELGLDKEWNEFQRQAIAGLLLNWALDEEIPINKDMEIININKL
ncbi:acyl carrier protein [Anaerococcus sp. AGMB09787]|uniref:acyl carrier protein n=1 Tax=Anaerococcus sp. AGMB09787 TaxID=2922869 RepID=UPI001FAF189B|nr:acyl carrier protein [Anaerococcus sp. AGMB09787]